MKILQIIQNSTIGGAENHTRLFSKTLLKKGHHIHFVCPSGPYVERFMELEQLGAKITILEVGTITLPLIKKVREIIIRNKIDLIHTHMHRADVVGVLAAIGLRDVKVVSTIHNMAKFDIHGIVRKIYTFFPIRFAQGNMEKIFTVSEDTKNETVTYFKLAPSKVFTLLNGIDPEELYVDVSSQEMRNRLGFTRQDFLLTSVGRLSDGKGHKYLIKAVKYLVEKGVGSIKLLLVGKGEVEDELKQITRIHGLEKNVFFLGYRNDIPNILNCSDIYVHPSIWDSLPRSLLEAMAVGLPVIATNVSGIPEVVHDEFNGFLVEPRTDVDIAERILKIKNDEQLKNRIAQNAKKFVLKNCTMDNMVNKFLSQIKVNMN